MGDTQCYYTTGLFIEAHAIKRHRFKLQIAKEIDRTLHVSFMPKTGRCFCFEGFKYPCLNACNE